MPTKRSVRSASSPRLNPCACRRASARCARPYSILAFKSRAIARISSSPRSRRTTLPPKGNGNPVSWYHHSPMSSQRCSPQLSGDGDQASGQRLPRIGRCTLARHDARTVAISDAGTVGEQGVAIREIRVRMQRDGGDLQLTGERAPVQGFDVAELMHVPAAARVDLPSRHRPKHEGVVGVGAVGDVDRARHGSGHDVRPPLRVLRSASLWKFVSASRWASWPYSGRFRASSADSLRRKSAYARRSSWTLPNWLYACERNM